LSRFQKKNKDQKSFCRTRRKKEWEGLFPRRFFLFLLLFFRCRIWWLSIENKTRFPILCRAGCLHVYESKKWHMRVDACVCLVFSSSFFFSLSTFSIITRHSSPMTKAKVKKKKKKKKV